MDAVAVKTDSLNQKAERYVRKCERYQALLESLETNIEAEKSLLAAANQQHRDELGTTLTNPTLFEDYLRRAEKQTTSLKERLIDTNAKNCVLQNKINALREENNLSIREIERHAVEVKVAETKKIHQRELAKSFNEDRETLQIDIERLQAREAKAHEEFTVSLGVAKQLHKQKTAEEGRRLHKIRQQRKYTRAGHLSPVKKLTGPVSNRRIPKNRTPPAGVRGTLSKTKSSGQDALVRATAATC